MTNDHESRPDTTPPADRDWLGGRRWTGIAAVGMLILIGVAVVIIIASRHHGSTPPAASSPSATSATRTTLPTAASRVVSAPSSANLPTVPPTTAPAGTFWVIYQTVALPQIHQIGPLHVAGAIATGYTHTPTGALLACVNEGLRYQLAPDSEFRPAAAAMLVRGTGYNAWLKARVSHPYGAAGAAGGGNLGQIAGFQFVSYTVTDAVIQIATRQTDGTLSAATEHVMWRDGDWKFVTGPDGGSAANIQQVNNLDGFIEWRGV